MTTSFFIKEKIHRLIWGSEGFALALTIVLWPVLVMMVAGVYVTGETIRQRMLFQNAADSGAYAGALVQADALSRLAVINKVMAWTYVEANKMEMDCLEYEWLTKAKNQLSAVGDDVYVRVNGTQDVKMSDIRTAVSAYNSTSFKASVTAAYANLKALNDAAAAIGSSSLKTRIEKAAKQAVGENLPEFTVPTADIYVGCNESSNYLKESSGITGSALSEADFLSFTSTGTALLNSTENPGIGTWWVLDGSKLQRRYQQTSDGKLKVEYSTSSPTRTISASDIYQGKSAAADCISAEPLVVQNTFGSNGRILVSLRHPLSNPLAKFFGDLTGSYYDAYTVSDTDIWVIAAAQAGYNKDSAYQVSVSELAASANSDWNAVMVPVSYDEVNTIRTSYTDLKGYSSNLTDGTWLKH